MIRHIFFLSIGIVLASNLWSQKPAEGIYTYDVSFAEWAGKSNGVTVLVKIEKSDSVFVYHNGGNLSGTKGELIAKGILMQHTSGTWIIAKDPKDRTAKEIGGCTDGPLIIDFKRNVFHLC